MLNVGLKRIYIFPKHIPVIFLINVPNLGEEVIDSVVEWVDQLILLQKASSRVMNLL